LRSNIEITDLARYDLWFEEKFGIAAGMHENVSERILKISELEIEDISFLQNIVDDQDKKLYEIISSGLDRSGALSVRGADLQLDRRLRVNRPLNMSRRSSVLWQSLRGRFSIVGRIIRNFLSTLRLMRWVL
jgi:hypothetical protein